MDAIKQLEHNKAVYEAKVYELALKRISSPKAKYDVVDANNSGKRRKSRIETEPEDRILRPYDRLKLINLSRDIERNFTAARAILKQFKVNVVGNFGKLQLNTDDENANKAANNYFNRVWSNACDSRDDLTFNEILKLIVASVIREGDVLVAFDDFDRMDGRLIMWEADQLVEIEEKDWKMQTDWTESVQDGKKRKSVPLRQSSGVIYDSRGRVMAYVVTGKRGLTSSPIKDVTILPKGTAMLVKNPFRFNQLRGTGDFFSAISDMEDLYEMRAKELQTAKLAATWGATIHKEDPVDEAIFRGGVSPEALLETAEGTDPSTSENKNYDNLETLTGGLMEYMLPGEEFKPIDFNRPNVHMKEFFEFVLQSCGAGFGLAKAYSRMEAYNSYTAFRGEMLMTWQTFYEWQKFLERHVCDWVARKALRFSKINLPDGWESQISWTWPVMPQVDPVKDNQARRDAMKDGFSDFSDFLGPDWKKKLESVADGLNVARELGLPLSAFEAKSGAPLTSYEDVNNNNGGDNE